MKTAHWAMSTRLQHSAPNLGWAQRQDSGAHFRGGNSSQTSHTNVSCKGQARKFCSLHAFIQIAKTRSIFRWSKTLLRSYSSFLLSLVKLWARPKWTKLVTLTSIIHASGESKSFNELEFSIPFHEFHAAETPWLSWNQTVGLFSGVG